MPNKIYRYFFVILLSIVHFHVTADTVTFTQAEAEFLIGEHKSIKSINLPYLWEREQGRISGKTNFKIEFSFDKNLDLAY